MQMKPANEYATGFFRLVSKTTFEFVLSGFGNHSDPLTHWAGSGQKWDTVGLTRLSQPQSLFDYLVLQRNLVIPENVAGSGKGLRDLVNPNVANCKDQAESNYINGGGQRESHFRGPVRFTRI